MSRRHPKAKKQPTAAAAQQLGAPSDQAGGVHIVSGAERLSNGQLSTADERTKYLRLRSWFEQEHRRQEVNRYQMALDCDYYDGHQWTPEEAREIRSRGQNPIVFNEIQPTIDWLKGTQRRMRRDFKVLARYNASKEAGEDADTKTALLKYIDDVNRAPFERSSASDDQMIAGMGCLEVGISNDPDDEPIFVRSESWKNVLHDSLNPTRDVNDGRYFFRFKEIDLDIAQAFFPKKRQELERSAVFGDLGDVDDGDWNGAWPTSRINGDSGLPARWLTYNLESDVMNSRRRVSIVECWYREPTIVDVPGVIGGVVKMKVRVALFTKQDLLLDVESPYAHNRYPFIAVWCYRSQRDGLPYGKIRNIRGPQDDLNKRMSKSQFLLSSKQVVAEKSAIDDETMDEDEIRDEINAPDGFAIVADGALAGNKIKFLDGADFTTGHLALADRDAFAIRSTSGVSMESRAQDTSAPSGKARAIKAEQQSVITAEIFDNQLLAHQFEGELCLSLIEQFYSDEKTFSVTGERFKLKYYTINQRDPATGQVMNSVTAHKAQFIIGEQAWQQALAQAAFESAMEMLGQLAPVAPQVVTSIIDLVFEWSDLPNKQSILQRIRQATGMSDPNGGDEDPAMAAEKQQKAQVAQLEFTLNLTRMRAEIAELQAKGAKLDAETMAKKMETLYMSAQAAQVLAATPSAMPVADELLKSAGFADAAQQAGVIDAAAMPAQPATPDPNAQPVPDPLQADGAQQGIETPAADGVRPQPEGVM